MKKVMRFTSLSAILLLAACGGGGDGAEGGNDTDAPNANGEQIYENNCSFCHGADLSGGAGPNLQNVGDKYERDEIVHIILNGKGNMQKVNVSEEDAQTVADWLLTRD
ncbi:cytochrome c551 [Salirhabdus salicampi]|uniref:cytochrome c551 n=1 Tax=Salirhabdus salicampi TaxID=476102 RepID=UPI0020C50288|nr:cytochrome c [Salirhabdus salicampi]MCP8617615.1 cytochrome c [Salirhabdus salicampi]